MKQNFNQILYPQNELSITARNHIMLGCENKQADCDFKTFSESSGVVYELLKNQRKGIKTVGNYGMMKHPHFAKVETSVQGDIFDTLSDECCLYTGYVRPNTCAQISFNCSKVVLNRLLYLNYVEQITQADVITNTCSNKGKCSKLSHLKRKERKNSTNSTKKLSPNEVIQIRYLIDEKKISVKDIAQKHAVSTTCVKNIKNSKTHKISQKLQILSDTHLEFWHPTKGIDSVTHELEIGETNDCNIAILGDIGYPDSDIYKKFIELLSRTYKNVFVVAGNHEYYSSKYTVDEINYVITLITNQFVNVHYLQNASVTIDNVKYIGATLWTSIDENNYGYVKNNISDYIKIFKHTTSPNGHQYKENITPQDTTDFNKLSFEYLKTEIQKTPETIKIVILTHHAPIETNSHDISKLTQTYENNYEAFIHKNTKKIKIWVFGHTHKHFEKKIGTTLIVSNPVGYIDEITGYVPNKLLDV